MSITVLKIMEEVGSRQEKRIVNYINEGLSEIADLVPDVIARSLISVVDGTRFYNLPSSYKKLEGVYQLIDTTNSIYQRIQKIQNVDLLEDSSASSTSEDSDMIIV